MKKNLAANIDKPFLSILFDSIELNQLHNLVKKILIEVLSRNDQAMYTFICKTYLFKLITIGKKTLLEEFLQSNDVDVNVCNSAGDTPLIYAIKQDRYDCFKLLCDHPKIDLNRMKTQGYLALKSAVDQNMPEYVRYLLEKNVNTNAILSVLYEAIEKERTNIVDLFFEKQSLLMFLYYSVYGKMPIIFKESLKRILGQAELVDKELEDIYSEFRTVLEKLPHNADKKRTFQKIGEVYQEKIIELFLASNHLEVSDFKLEFFKESCQSFLAKIDAKLHYTQVHHFAKILKEGFDLSKTQFKKARYEIMQKGPTEYLDYGPAYQQIIQQNQKCIESIYFICCQFFEKIKQPNQEFSDQDMDVYCTYMSERTRYEGKAVFEILRDAKNETPFIDKLSQFMQKISDDSPESKDPDILEDISISGHTNEVIQSKPVTTRKKASKKGKRGKSKKS